MEFTRAKALCGPTFSRALQLTTRVNRPPAGEVDDGSNPLTARVSKHNLGSLRVLEKCGFRVIATERSVAEARSAEIEELVLRLDELASPG